jgi:cold shock CspA family protein
MSNQRETAICRKCGKGFVLTAIYQDFLARRGARVTTPMQCMSCFLKRGPLPKQSGKIKWYSPHKHYGFIVTEKDKEVFFHQNELVADNGSSLQEGQEVWFHVRQATKGPEAINVEIPEPV